MYDTILRGGRVIDPSQDIDMTTDVAFKDGTVAAFGNEISDEAVTVIDVTGKIVAPGLIDTHAHVNWGATYLSVEAEIVAKKSGTTTFIDAGSAGAGTFHGFRRHVIEPSPLRIIAFLNISHAGIYGYGPGFMVGESADLRLLHSSACIDVARQHSDLICGIKVRLGGNVSGTLGTQPLDIAIDAAEELDLPVMVHIGPTPPRRQDILERLRPGDILTHCCRMFPNALIDRERNIRAEVEDAHQRGVIFDVGHGRGSFDFKVARAMVENGFTPDIISSDVHIVSVDGPAFDVLVTMSKFLCLGLTLPEVLRTVTVNAARAINRPELGSLKPGSPGDATVLRINEGEFEYYDSLGHIMIGKQKLEVAHILIAGKRWP